MESVHIHREWGKKDICQKGAERGEFCSLTGRLLDGGRRTGLIAEKERKQGGEKGRKEDVSRKGPTQDTGPPQERYVNINEKGFIIGNATYCTVFPLQIMTRIPHVDEIRE
ncbi:uncharacterized protein LOC106670595 [Cimex lectularius]|uniref:Uncharacterized protein n=1 Tax=Cimex lectularius TaxID=79782 RepID=A0A8I6S5P7_CIMLE|nr:uncharacterized protein LOC106670595 [Cimex lectularius]